MYKNDVRISRATTRREHFFDPPRHLVEPRRRARVFDVGSLYPPSTLQPACHIRRYEVLLAEVVLERQPLSQVRTVFKQGFTVRGPTITALV
jgi:hypothetical protein